jgi:ribosomal protein L16
LLSKPIKIDSSNNDNDNNMSWYHLRFGVYGFRALEEKWMDKRQIDALRLLLQRKLRDATGKRAELWTHVEPNVPVTKRTEKRMGGGKSPIKGWKGRVKQGQILFEWAAPVEIPVEEIQSKCSVRLRSVVDPVYHLASMQRNWSL